MQVVNNVKSYPINKIFYGVGIYIYVYSSKICTIALVVGKMGEPSKVPDNSPDLDEVLLMNETTNKPFERDDLLEACKVVENTDNMTKKHTQKL